MLPKASTVEIFDLQLSVSSCFKNWGRACLIAWLEKLAMILLSALTADVLTYSFWSLIELRMWGKIMSRYNSKLFPMLNERVSKRLRAATLRM